MSEVNWNAFQWEGRNELWDEVLGQLDTYHDAEVDFTAGPDLTSEQRHYSAGRLAALMEFRDHLMNLRRMAESNRK